MGRLAAILWVMAVLPAGAEVQSAQERWPARLSKRVKVIDEGHPGELTVYVRDVTSRQALVFGAREPVYLSSTLKLVVALEVLRRFDEGTLSPGQRVRFRPVDLRDGVGPLSSEHLGEDFTVEHLLELMLVHSDNAAADRLIGLVGVRRLEEHLARRGVRFGPLVSLLDERRHVYGLLDPRGAQLEGAEQRSLGQYDSLAQRAEAFGRMMNGPSHWGGQDLARAFRAFYETGLNSAPAAELGELLAQLSRCEGLSTASCERLHALMQACRTGRARIRAGLPARTPWAHKTGTQYQRACDVGFALLEPERPVVIVACARDFTRVSDAEAAFAAVGDAVWEVLGPSR